MNVPSHKFSLVLMIIAPTMWSSAGVLTRQLESHNSFEISFWRSLFTGLFVLCAFTWQHPNRIIPKLKSIEKLGIISGLMWAIMFSCFMLALTMTTVANALIVMSFSPLLTSLLAYFFLKQVISIKTWLAIVVAFFGMLWMFIEGFTSLDSRGFAGVMLAMCVPVASSVNVIMMKKGGSHIDLMPAIFIGGVVSCLMMLPFAFPFSAPLKDISILAVLGVFQLGLPCMLMVYAAKTLAAPELSLLCLIEVLLGPLWVWISNGEVPAQSTLLGGAVVLSALVFNELSALKIFYRRK